MGYKLNFDESLGLWLDLVKNNDSHVTCLPNIKKIVNKSCIDGDRNRLLKLHTCIVYIRDVLSNKEDCGDDEECKECYNRKMLLRCLNAYILKIKASVNIG